eukprot:TRINITY_DN278_c0_g1_i11.p2 TRINITY_DN278_c0_g1~~TRINITY_DN278_c0_g1_i11.p2  ORF type:complete len:132 (-),score=21.55 TRINITY_DN278_c0_g1_i11:1565-1960(-)
MATEDELVDYEEGADDEKAVVKSKEIKKGSYVGIHSSGFRDFLLKQELLLAIQDCGFEHPSEVQQNCIPQAVLGQILYVKPNLEWVRHVFLFLRFSSNLILKRVRWIRLLYVTQENLPIKFVKNFCASVNI